MKKSSIKKIEVIYVLQEKAEINPETLKEINFKNMAEIAAVRAAGYTDEGKTMFHSSVPTHVGRFFPIPQLKITRKSGGVYWKNMNTVFTED